MAKRRAERTPWHVAFEIVEPYVVKITTPEASGTGFLVASTAKKELLGIATAAHVIDFPHYWEQPIRIQHFKSGKTVFLNHADRLIDIDYAKDTASIVIRGGEIPSPNEALPIISEDKHLKVGVEVGVDGVPRDCAQQPLFLLGQHVFMGRE